jgi:hypothetical protein
MRQPWKLRLLGWLRRSHRSVTRSRVGIRRQRIEFQLAQEPIAASTDGLNKRWFVGRVSQRIPELAYGHCQAMVEIDKGIFRPEALAKFFTSDDFTREL